MSMLFQVFHYALNAYTKLISSNVIGEFEFFEINRITILLLNSNANNLATKDSCLDPILCKDFFTTHFCI